MPFVHLGFPCKVEGGSLSSEAGRGNSCQDWKVVYRSGLQAASYCPERVVDCNVHFFDVRAPTPGWGTVFSDRKDKGLGGYSEYVGRGSPGRTSKASDK